MIVNAKRLQTKKAAGELPGGLYPIWLAAVDTFRTAVLQMDMNDWYILSLLERIAGEGSEPA
jgi:hypothetical protein